MATGEFEAVLRAQVAEARHRLAAARADRDYAGIKSYGQRLRYLLDIAAEHQVELPGDDAPQDRAVPGPGGV
ncbi:hypothetical protein KGA66_14520 [Actinocrinis puniceicyclus]|uniref:Uncharacterized protein n=1 Tax=Actinocrinis puniceicyclus TaxID=977794 RepID=A0A8J7WL14_9ACTN|nr:hypothetical protein [Actinocrinis puniceicyclus]MBS2964271.1 hypothetical protein [Actinocrinis puniceicyclus]